MNIFKRFLSAQRIILDFNFKTKQFSDVEKNQISSSGFLNNI